jgi:hypothetical protein
METWTIGIEVNSSPNIILNGTKTPWSSPGPGKPLPSSPLASFSFDNLASNPAWVVVLSAWTQKEKNERMLTSLYKSTTLCANVESPKDLNFNWYSSGGKP